MVWLYLDVSDIEENYASHLSDDKNITSNNSHCSDFGRSSCSSEPSFFNDTSYFIEKDEHNFNGNDNEYDAVLTELLNQWSDLISGISTDILRYLRRGLERNSTIITNSMIPTFFSYGAKIMHNFRGEIFKRSGDYRDDLLRDLVATIVDDVERPEQLRTYMPSDKFYPQPIETHELSSMIQERIRDISEIDRNPANSRSVPDWRSLLAKLLDCVEACRVVPDK